MITAADFPNLNAPIWDRIRISRRRTPAEIAETMCLEARIDPELVRTHYPSRKATPPGLVELRCRIVVAMKREGLGFKDAQTWFDFSIGTLQDYFVEGKKLEAVNA